MMSEEESRVYLELPVNVMRVIHEQGYAVEVNDGKYITVVKEK